MRTDKTPADFVNEYNGVGIDYDGAYGIQCVDSFRVFCDWLEIPSLPTPTGWASGFWTGTKNQAWYKYFDEVAVKDLQDGDIVIWPYGCKSHPSSHIAMYYKGYEFGQNQGYAHAPHNLKTTVFSDAYGGLRYKYWKKKETAPAFVPIEPEDYAVFRLYNPNSGEHFFTADYKEANTLKKIGWNYEGIAWYHGGGKYVYRLYNGTEHFYTTDEEERQALINYGWKDEGVAFSDTGEGTPVFRLYNPTLGLHLYTTSTNERDWLKDGDWIYEGIAFYGQAK